MRPTIVQTASHPLLSVFIRTERFFDPPMARVTAIFFYFAFEVLTFRPAARQFAQCRVYAWAMQEPAVNEPRQKLIRLRADRRGVSLDLRVHYEVSQENGCQTYRIITVEEVN